MSTATPTPAFGEPSWQVAHLFPPEGHWTEDEYLALNTNQLVEFSDGSVEVLPMPTEAHELIAAFLYRTMYAFVSRHSLGLVLSSGIRVRLWEGKFRQPDIVFMLKENANRRSNPFWLGADLVMEVVSDDDPPRDLKTKRAEYARAGIPEYLIVDPRDETITVLTPDAPGTPYREAGKYAAAEQATSVLLEGFTVDVRETFSQDA